MPIAARRQALACDIGMANGHSTCPGHYDPADDGGGDESFPPDFTAPARRITRVVPPRLQNTLANELLSGRFEEGTTITVDATPDGFVFGEKDEAI